MNDIEYSKVTNEDVDTLVDYRVQFALELTGEQSPEAIAQLKEQLTRYFSGAVNSRECIAYIARENGKVAGIGAMMIRTQPGNFKNPSGKWGYLMNMYTVPGFRRKGICSGLLTALIEDAEKQGITAFELHATKEGEIVYKKNGFEIHQEPTLRKYV